MTKEILRVKEVTFFGILKRIGCTKEEVLSEYMKVYRIKDYGEAMKSFKNRATRDYLNTTQDASAQRAIIFRLLSAYFNWKYSIQGESKWSLYHRYWTHQISKCLIEDDFRNGLFSIEYFFSEPRLKCKNKLQFDEELV